MSSKRKLTPFRRKYLRFRNAEKRREVKLQCIAYKGGACERCGYNKCPAALVFHHLNPEEKDFAISANGVSRSFEKCKSELNKCILLCQNCHNEIHAEENEKRRLIKLEEIETEKRKLGNSLRKNCAFCNKEIDVFNSQDAQFNYCNRNCRTKHRNYLIDLEWPSNEELLNMRKELSVKEICKKLNKPRSSVYERLNKIAKEVA